MIMNSLSPAGEAAASPPVLVSGLWVGDELPPLVILSIQSFLDHGHRFQLFSYREFPNLPAGAIYRDAAELIPEESVFVHTSGSLAHFSDWFRFLFLYREGGFWVDMDIICLSGQIPKVQPYFAAENDHTVGTGVLSFPPGHPLIKNMLDLCLDPLEIMPWDNETEKAQKDEVRQLLPDVAERRKLAPWGYTGPFEFTKAVKHYDLSALCDSQESVYPVYYPKWNACFNGTFHLEDEFLSHSWGFHFWNEMRRRSDKHTIEPGSLIDQLMKRHRVQAQKKVSVLVGICSAAHYTNRRNAVRETWLSQPHPDMECLFFIGKTNDPVREKNLVELNANDKYEYLPEKVLAFLKYALDHYDFDWLFKCDDDTYINFERLAELTRYEADLIGDISTSTRGAPSGGAGYMLSRDMVERLVRDENIKSTGCEDLIFGEKVKELGGLCFTSSRLCLKSSEYPRPNNDLITSHWCSENHLKAIHTIFYKKPVLVAKANHHNWTDDFLFYEEGFFCRKSTFCYGMWSLSDSRDELTLSWFHWNAEKLQLTEPLTYACDVMTLALPDELPKLKTE